MHNLPTQTQEQSQKKPSSQGMEMWKRCISDLVQLMYQTIAYIWTVYVLMFSL